MTPPDNTALRGLLTAIAIAHDSKNDSLLAALLDTATEHRADIRVYITYLRDELSQSDYRIYTPEDGLEAKQQLESEAYGNFIEAATALAYDAHQGPLGKDPARPTAEKFNPKLFSDEDKALWDKTYPAIETLWLDSNPREYDGDRTQEVIRTYLQKYLGPLQETHIASYLDREKQRGVTVQLTFSDRALIRSGDKAVQKTLEQLSPKSPSQIPEHIDQLELQGIAKANLFDYELHQNATLNT